MPQADNIVQTLMTGALQGAASDNFSQLHRTLKSNVARIENLKEFRLDEYAIMLSELIIMANAIDASIILSEPSLVERIPKHAQRALHRAVDDGLYSGLYERFEWHMRTISNSPAFVDDRRVLGPFPIFRGVRHPKIELDDLSDQIEKIRQESEEHLRTIPEDKSACGDEKRESAKSALILTNPDILDLLSHTECLALVACLNGGLHPLWERGEYCFSDLCHQFR
jgi:hypothetical protein